MMTTREFAALLGYSQRHVIRLIRSGMPAQQIGRDLFVDPAKAKAYLKSRKISERGRPFKITV